MINTYMSQVARIIWGLIVLSVTVSPDFEIEEQQCGMAWAALVVCHVMEGWKRRNMEDIVLFYSLFVTSCCGIFCVKLCFVPSFQQSFCFFDSLFNNNLLLALTSGRSVNTFVCRGKQGSKSCSCAWFPGYTNHSTVVRFDSAGCRKLRCPFRNSPNDDASIEVGSQG
jgi:hypothetical protein